MSAQGRLYTLMAFFALLAIFALWQAPARPARAYNSSIPESRTLQDSLEVQKKLLIEAEKQTAELAEIRRMLEKGCLP